MGYSPLTRREALRAIGATSTISLAGCTTGIGDRSDPDGNRAGDPTSTSPTETLSPVTADEFEFDVEVLQQFTANHTASVRFSFSNTGNRQFILSPSELGPLNEHAIENSGSPTAKLVLVGSDAQLEDPETNGGTEPPSEPQNGCWTLDANLVIPVGLEYGELAPGKTISEDFTCYAHRENENCLPAGAYGFTESHELQPGSIGQDGRRGPTANFEFQISLLMDERGALSVEVEYR